MAHAEMARSKRKRRARCFASASMKCSRATMTDANRKSSSSSPGPSDPTQGLDERPTQAPRPRAYLVVFEGDSSRMLPLPDRGDIVLGRAEDVDVRLDDAGVS